MAFPTNTESLAVRFGSYIEELHEFFASRGMHYGSPQDIVPFAEALSQPGSFQDEMASMVRSIIYREREALPRTELLELVAVAIGGPQIDQAADKVHEPVRQLLAFLGGVLRPRRPASDSEEGDAAGAPGITPATSNSVAPASAAGPDAPIQAAAIPVPATITVSATPPLQQIPPPAEPALSAHSTAAPAPEHTAAPDTAAPITSDPVSATLVSAWAASRPHNDASAAARSAAVPDSEVAALAPVSTYTRKGPVPVPAFGEAGRNGNLKLFPAPVPIRGTQEADNSFADSAPPQRRSLWILGIALVLLALAIGLIFGHRSTVQPASVQGVTQPSVTPSTEPVPVIPGKPTANGQTAPNARSRALGYRRRNRDYADGEGQADPGAPLTDQQPMSSSNPANPSDDNNTSPQPDAQPPSSNPSSNPPNASSNSAQYAPSVGTDTNPPYARPLPGYSRTSHAARPYRYRSPGTFAVSSGVMAGNLISAPAPQYPKLASLARIDGPVVIQAVISKSGNVIATHVMSGHRLLRGAASNAVRHWKYRPFLVDGRKTDVATIITVDFSLPH